MKIHLKKGIHTLIFGMNQIQVEELLGRPNRIQIDSEDSNELIWEFNILKLRLIFYQNENDKLGYISCSNPKLRINGQKIIDQEIKEVIKLIMSDSNTYTWKKEEYDLFTTFFNEENWLTLNVEYGRITSIELGVPFKNEDDYDWPK